MPIRRSSAYGSKLNRDAEHRSDCGGGRAVRSLLCDQLDLRAEPGLHSHRQVQPQERLSTTTAARFDGSQPTFPKLLQAAGYQTAIVGKWHLVSEPTGFDHWDILPGQGQYYRPDFITAEGQADGARVRDRGDHRPGARLARRTSAMRAKPFLLDGAAQGAASAVGAGGGEAGRVRRARSFPSRPRCSTITRTAARRRKRAEMRISQMKPSAIVKLWDEASRRRKFLLQPHERGGPRGVGEARRSAAGGVSRRANPQGRRRGRGGSISSTCRITWRASSRSTTASGSCSIIWTTSGLAENTIVVYTSDQGFYLGEHGWFDKRFMYEESLRTPLVVRWPGVAKPGSVEERIVSNVDFAQTFLEAAGVERAGRHAGPQPGAAAARRVAGRLAEVVLLSLLRRIRGREHHVAQARGRDDRPGEADPLLHDRRMGAVRSGEGPARDGERVRAARVCEDASGIARGAGAAARGARGAGEWNGRSFAEGARREDK